MSTKAAGGWLRQELHMRQSCTTRMLTKPLHNPQQDSLIPKTIPSALAIAFAADAQHNELQRAPRGFVSSGLRSLKLAYRKSPDRCPSTTTCVRPGPLSPEAL